MKITMAEVIMPAKSTKSGERRDCPACRQPQPTVQATHGGETVTACGACLEVLTPGQEVLTPAQGQGKPLPKPTTETRPGPVEETR